MQKNYKNRDNRLFYRTNQQIRASELRVLDQDNKQLGVFSVPEAIAKAREMELDLIEIAPKATPPVAKIADYKKFLYQQNKKLAAQAKNTVKGGLKEIRLTPFMADGDLEVRIKRINEFLEDRYKVRLVVRFTGRQMGRTEFGYKIIQKVLEKLGTTAKIEQEPKMIGRQILMTITSA